MAREMAIQLGAIDPRTKKPYTEESDMTGWYRGFMERCEKKGCSLKVRNGHGMHGCATGARAELGDRRVLS